MMCGIFNFYFNTNPKRLTMKKQNVACRCSSGLECWSSILERLIHLLPKNILHCGG